MARTDTLGNFLTDVADAIREKKGTTESINASDFDTEIQNLPSGGGAKMFTGHVDSIGLKQIGWSDEDIQYFQDYGVQWEEESDDDFKLTPTELAGDDSANTRYLPKTSTKNVFTGYKLLFIPKINTVSKTSFSNMFSSCQLLTTIPEIDTSNGTSFSSMFQNCYSLEKTPRLNTSKGASFSNMFQYCYSLKSISPIDTSKSTTFSNMFNSCYSLKTIPELNCSKITNVNNMFSNCYSLISIGGLTNIGESYLTTQSANYYNYTINLNASTNLSHDSLMNIINGLYDIASKGVKTQTLSIGTINLAKLTEEEKAIATNKGWTVS